MHLSIERYRSICLFYVSIDRSISIHSIIFIYLSIYLELARSIYLCIYYLSIYLARSIYLCMILTWTIAAHAMHFVRGSRCEILCWKKKYDSCNKNTKSKIRRLSGLENTPVRIVIVGRTIVEVEVLICVANAISILPKLATKTQKPRLVASGDRTHVHSFATSSWNHSEELWCTHCSTIPYRYQANLRQKIFPRRHWTCVCC